MFVSAGFLPDKKANSRHRRYQLLACLGILCVILLLGLIAVCYFLARLSRDITELNQLKENLTNLNYKLSLDNDNFRRERSNLTVQLGNLTQNYTVLESKITNLTTENQQLKTERNNLTELIQTMETNRNELKISRAQWTIDAYCPKETNGRQCKACLKGWKHNKASCYVIHNADTSDQITWEQARENCRGRNADMVVVQNQLEKTLINDYSWGKPEESGYWIGLRVEEGKWKWIDGSDLTQTSWIGAPTEGHCAVSIQTIGWTSEMCEEKKRWICKQEALTV
ncbi:C-type lectin domain family 10 member A-like [Anarrhichthys ocellatus]|uniref:C-type lectin domain family 10 member A-like n=1 Tax=Anarrhichthys ocellatus TaxID=433405 RepID=UPI0012ED32A9|nr:C-type lectin domain family 10 member A-like [Anarrhichthys ocellatus]